MCHHLTIVFIVDLSILLVQVVGFPTNVSLPGYNIVGKLLLSTSLPDNFDNWIPILEQAASWNGWTEEESLMQLAGHLRGRALLEC